MLLTSSGRSTHCRLPLAGRGRVWISNDNRHPYPKQFEENTTIRRPYKADAPVKEGPRANTDIRVPRVQLIGVQGENRGEVSINEALLAAEDLGLDLVEISPNANQPVTRRS